MSKENIVNIERVSNINAQCLKLDYAPISNFTETLAKIVRLIKTLTGLLQYIRPLLSYLNYSIRINSPLIFSSFCNFSNIIGIWSNRLARRPIDLPSEQTG